MIDVLGNVMSKDMKDAQEEELDIWDAIWYVQAGKQITLVQIQRFKSKMSESTSCSLTS